MLLECPSKDFFFDAMSLPPAEPLAAATPKYTAHSAPPTAGTTSTTAPASSSGEQQGQQPPAKRRFDPPAARRLPINTPVTPAVDDTQRRWIAETIDLILAGQDAAQEAIRRLPAQIRRELIKNIAAASGGASGGGTPRSSGGTPRGRARTTPAEAPPLAKQASPTFPWGTASQPSYAESPPAPAATEVLPPPDPPAQPRPSKTTKMPRPSARDDDMVDLTADRTEEETPPAAASAAPAAPNTPEDPPPRYFAFVEKHCTRRNPPAQFANYYPVLRDKTHWRRVSDRVKWDLELLSAQCRRPWLPTELDALRLHEIDEVAAMEEAQARAAYPAPIVAANEAAYTGSSRRCRRTCRAHASPTGRTPSWSSDGADTHAPPATAACCLRPIIIGAEQPHRPHLCNKCYKGRDD